MKKTTLLVLFASILLLLLAGCNKVMPSEVSIEVTPALTPILLDGASTETAASSAPSMAPEGANESGPGVVDALASGLPAPARVIAGANAASAQRTPIVLKVPLIPASTVAPAAVQPPAAVDASAAAAASPSAGSAPANSSTAPPTPVELPTPAPLPEESGEEEGAGDVTDEAPHGIPVSLDDTLNILVVGSDERHPGQPWRSDVIMVVSVDYTNRQIGVISFPRDLWVEIPTVGENRINTATFFGGAYNYPNGGDIGLLKDTLAHNFGIRIDHYAKFNFETFKDVIDALDGIDIVVDCPITGRFPVKPGSKELVWQTLPAGQYHMDGEFALRYVRERKTTSDVDRNRRQQRVLIAMRKRAREVNIVPRIPALYDAMRDNIETDLGLTDIIALTRLGLQVSLKDVHGFNIGYKEADSWRTPGGAAVLKPDMAKIQEGIQNLFLKPSILKNPNKPKICR